MIYGISILLMRAFNDLNYMSQELDTINWYAVCYGEDTYSEKDCLNAKHNRGYWPTFI